MAAAPEVTAGEGKVGTQVDPNLTMRRFEVVDVQGHIRDVGPLGPLCWVGITAGTAEIGRDHDGRSLWETNLGGMAGARAADGKPGGAAA